MRYEDDEWADLLTLARENRVSRKDRICSNCFQTIAKGESYVHEFHIIDGDAVAINRHPNPYQCPPKEHT